MHRGELLSNLWRNREKENVRRNRKMHYLPRLYMEEQVFQYRIACLMRYNSFRLVHGFGMIIENLTKMCYRCSDLSYYKLFRQCTWHCVVLAVTVHLSRYKAPKEWGMKQASFRCIQKYFLWCAVNICYILKT
jgi:hypothetical protein